MADRRLQVFNTVARLLSFTKAADTLHMTQPAVTFQVRQLEESLGARLFDRAHNRISLTNIGKIVYTHSQKILDDYIHMEKSVQDLTGNMDGCILLGASTTIAEYVLPPLLGKFKEQYPTLSVQLVEANSESIIEKIENNEIDLGIVESTVNNKKLNIKIFQKDEVVLIVSPNHKLAKLKELSVQKVLNYPCILRESGSGTREVIASFLKDNNLNIEDMEVAMEMGGPESIKGAVESNIGISIMSRICVAKELQLGTLKEVRLIPRLERYFSLIYKNQQFRMRGIDKLLDFFSKNCNP